MKKVISVFVGAVIGGVIVTVYVITPYLLKTGSHWLDFLELCAVAFVLAVTMMMALCAVIFAFKGVTLTEPPQRPLAPLAPKQPGCEKCKQKNAILYNRTNDMMLCDTCMMNYPKSNDWTTVADGIVKRLTDRMAGDHVQNT